MKEKVLTVLVIIALVLSIANLTLLLSPNQISNGIDETARADIFELKLVAIHRYTVNEVTSLSEAWSTDTPFIYVSVNETTFLNRTTTKDVCRVENTFYGYPSGWTYEPHTLITYTP